MSVNTISYCVCLLVVSTSSWRQCTYATVYNCRKGVPPGKEIWVILLEKIPVLNELAIFL